MACHASIILTSNLSHNHLLNPLLVSHNKPIPTSLLGFQVLRKKRVSISIQAMGSYHSSQKPDSVKGPSRIPKSQKIDEIVEDEFFLRRRVFFGQGDYTSVSNDEWKQQLTAEQFYVTRQKGTERAFTGQYWNTKTPGTYHCICCDTPLFESSTKFDSGTGWPSYYQGIGNNVKSKLDMSIIFMPRTEVLCATCDAHLGHVFDDGPPPTRKRYCINSASLKLKPE